MLFLVIFTFNFHSTIAQTNSKIPSVSQLDSIIRLKNSDEKILVQLDSIFQKLNFPNINYSLLQRQQGLALAKKIDQPFWIGRMQYHLGSYYFYNTNRNDYLAIKHLKRAVEELKKGNGKWNQAIMEVFSQTRNLYAAEQDYDKLLEASYDFLDFFENTQDTFHLVKTFNVIAYSLMGTNKFEAALRPIQQGFDFIKIPESLLDKCLLLEQQATCFYNLGDSIKTFNAIDSAINLVDKIALPPPQKKFYQTFFRTRRGDLHLKNNNLELAQKNIEDAFEKMGKPVTFGYLYLDMGVLLHKKKQYQEANEYFEKFRKFYPTSKEAHLIMSENFAAMNEYEKAFILHEKYWSHQDSLFQRDTKSKLERIQTEFETEKKDVQILQQEKLIAQQKRTQFLTYGILGLLAILMSVLFYNFRKNKTTNQQLKNLNKDLGIKNTELDQRNAENELLLKEIHHRVKNNLETVSSLLALQSAQISDPMVLDAIQESQNRVQSMGMIHQKLYQGKNLSAIEMKDYFINLGEGVLDSFGLDDRIRIECVMDELELDVDTAVPIGLIVNELLTNAMKYAFPKGREGTIKISMKEEGKHLKLEIADNGIGKEVLNKKSSKGFGTQLVHLLTQQLDGKLEEIVENGTIISLEFKKIKAA